MYNPQIPIDYPDLALIRCIQGHTPSLTMEDIDMLVYQLYLQTLVQAQYLFLGEADMRKLDEQTRVFVHWHEGPLTGALRRYHGLHVVVLPTLPEGTFLVGILDIQQRMTPQGVCLDSVAHYTRHYQRRTTGG